jgi:Ser/Thr protein kinase RdoA (MazF antagonist)
LSEFIAAALDVDTAIEESIFGTADPEAIWARVLEVCPDAAGCFAFEASVGGLAGAKLADGSRVAVKFHREPVDREHLRAVQDVQAHLRANGFPCPRPLGVRGSATVEEWLEVGEYRTADDAATRAVLASSLAEVVRLATGLRPLAGLEPDRAEDPPLWPHPHNVLFDFEATAAGAEWIDELARAARRVRDAGEARDVIGHADWTVKHVRFRGLRPTAVYDWDSLSCDREPTLVGWAAATFTYTEAFGPARWPALEEARAFVSAYEQARGAPFQAAELRALGGAIVYARAYVARCVHALGQDARTGVLSEFADALL